MMPQMRVEVKDTKGFAQQWNYKGVALVLDDYVLQFATDWANIVLKSFVQQCQEAAAAEAAKKKVIITE